MSTWQVFFFAPQWSGALYKFFFRCLTNSKISRFANDFYFWLWFTKTLLLSFYFCDISSSKSSKWFFKYLQKEQAKGLVDGFHYVLHTHCFYIRTYLYVSKHRNNFWWEPSAQKTLLKKTQQNKRIKMEKKVLRLIWSKCRK